MTIHARLVNGPRAGDDLELTRPLLSMTFSELPDVEVEQVFSEKALSLPILKEHRYRLKKVLYLYEYEGTRER